MIDWEMFRPFDPVGVAYWEGGKDEEHCKVVRKYGKRLAPFSLDEWNKACHPAYAPMKRAKLRRRK